MDTKLTDQEHTSTVPTANVTVTNTDTTQLNTEKEKLIPPTIFHDDETHDAPPPSYFEMTDRYGVKERYDNTCTLVGAVLVTLFCCAPFGIVAIIKAMTARVKHAYGDEYAAKDANRSAKRWMVSGIVVGVLIVVLYIGGFGLYIRQLIQMMRQQQELANIDDPNQVQQVYPNADHGAIPWQHDDADDGAIPWQHD